MRGSYDPVHVGIAHIVVTVHGCRIKIEAGDERTQTGICSRYTVRGKESPEDGYELCCRLVDIGDVALLNEVVHHNDTVGLFHHVACGWIPRYERGRHFDVEGEVF